MRLVLTCFFTDYGRPMNHFFIEVQNRQIGQINSEAYSPEHISTHLGTYSESQSPLSMFSIISTKKRATSQIFIWDWDYNQGFSLRVSVVRVLMEEIQLRHMIQYIICTVSCVYVLHIFFLKACDMILRLDQAFRLQLKKRNLRNDMCNVESTPLKVELLDLIHTHIISIDNTHIISIDNTHIISIDNYYINFILQIIESLENN